MREGRFKLIDFYAEKRVELYDLSNDLGERQNLMDAMPAKGKELLDQLNAWRTAVKADMPTSTPRARKNRSAAAREDSAG